LLRAPGVFGWLEAFLDCLLTAKQKNVEVNGKLVYFVKKHLEMYLSRIEFIDTESGSVLICLLTLKAID
jgi:hypothetical protein